MNSPNNKRRTSKFVKAPGDSLERLYCIWNKACYIHPDPLELVLPYPETADREIAALIASALAYGRVGRILASGAEILRRMGKSPRRFVENTDPERMHSVFQGFKHRFHTGDDIACLLSSVKKILEQYGSLEKCYLAAFDESDPVGSRAHFARRLCECFPCKCSTLLPSAEKGSACKRLNLMLRWLVRHDEVDPGGWNTVPAASLIVPLDTHMHRLAGIAGFTHRKAADLKTAIEITKAFARYSPADPVRYDFALTRFGIHPDFPKLPDGWGKLHR